MKWFSKILSNKRRELVNKYELKEDMSESSQRTKIPSDNPITRPTDDVLGRSKHAHSFSNQILSLDATQGIVAGVLGPWGSGKTSFVNMTKVYLEENNITVLEFNPWMFSGAEQLVHMFFIELSSQLKIRTNFVELGNQFEEYGEVFSGLGWLPLVGPWIERGRVVNKVLAKLMKRKKASVGELRIKISESLTKLQKPIVIILDDIDRLSTSEIRDIFKLVRLTANFPNIIYLLPFDRIRVEQALSEQGIPGRDYLEKILQLGVDLPAVPTNVLNTQIFNAIDTTIANIEHPGHFDSDLWPDVFMEIIKPLIRNMRDVRRYATSINGTIQDLNGNISLVDVLAIEAIRVFLPNVFQKIHLGIDGLTTTSDNYSGRREPPHLKEQIDALVEAGDDHKVIVINLIKRLFPAGQRHVGSSHYGSDWKRNWLRDRRVAHEDVLRYYFERVFGEQLQAYTEAEIVWSRMQDHDSFEEYLNSLPLERVEDVVSKLEVFEDQFTVDHVAPGIIVLLNLLPKVPERQLGMFDYGPKMVFGRVVYRLLRTVDDPKRLEDIVKEILPQISSLSSKHELITDIGYRKSAGHKLVTEEAAIEIEKEWRNEVRKASTETLVNEKDLLTILILTKNEAEDDEPELEIPNSTEITFALLKSARSDVRTQSMESRSVKFSPRLSWNTLVELVGDETNLRNRIEALKASPPKEIGDLIELADKYSNGWRPENFREG